MGGVPPARYVALPPMPCLSRARIATGAAAVALVAAVAVAIAHETPARRPLWGVGAFAVALGALMFTIEDR